MNNSSDRSLWDSQDRAGSSAKCEGGSIPQHSKTFCKRHTRPNSAFWAFAFFDDGHGHGGSVHAADFVIVVDVQAAWQASSPARTIGCE